MPRVNRDLQRRMAARRERDRRRPGGERRYQFTTPQPAPVEPDETVVEEDGEATAPVEAPAAAAPRLRETARIRAPARPGPKPFSEYRDEYKYVYGDLRRDRKSV